MPLLVPHTFITALKALKRNKMRSALTALGVIIGVGAVIAMMEIGQGSKNALQKTIASMGANTLLVQSGAATSGGVSFGSGSVMTLTPQDCTEIGRQCPAVADVTPIVRTVRKLFMETATGCPCKSAAPRRRFWRSAITMNFPRGKCLPIAMLLRPTRFA